MHGHQPSIITGQQLHFTIGCNELTLCDDLRICLGKRTQQVLLINFCKIYFWLYLSLGRIIICWSVYQLYWSSDWTFDWFSGFVCFPQFSSTLRLYPVHLYCLIFSFLLLAVLCFLFNFDRNGHCSAGHDISLVRTISRRVTQQI